MPTIFSHPAVTLGLAPWYRRLPKRLLAVAAVCSSVPDADVIAFNLDIPYGSALGHRGFTHSLLFALLLAATVAWTYRRLYTDEISFGRAFAFVFVAVASHGVLDAMTTGGKGVGFFIPFSMRRFFLPFRPIRVSLIGPSFLDNAGAVLGSELLWVWLPFAALAVVGLIVNALRRDAR